MIRRFTAGLALALSLTLAGCAPAPELTTSAAERLQEQVLAVTTAASEGRLPAAVTALDAAEADLDRAFDRNEVSPDRYRQILDALRLVRADVDAAIEKAEADAEAAREAELAKQIADLQAQQQAAAEQAAAEQAAAEQAAREQAAQEEAARQNGGNDEEQGNGNGNGNGNNGNGNGNGRGNGDD
jgi:hypothetical protein